MKIWQAVAAIVLLICMTSGATEEEQVVHFHPITPEEYDAILGLTNGSPVISEARLIASGLAAIKGIAAGIKTGFAAAWWLPTLLSTFGGTTPTEVKTNTDKVRDGYPLCVIRPGYFAEDDEEQPQRRGSSARVGRRKPPLPLAHCIVVVKQAEENIGVAPGVPPLIGGPTWSYPPPYPHPPPVGAEKPAVPGSYPYYPYPKYPGYPHYFGYPGYYATYPAGAPATEPPVVEEPTEAPTEEEPTEPPTNIIDHKQLLQQNIHKLLQHRSVPHPAYDWQLTPASAPHKPRSKKKKRDNHATSTPPQSYTQISNYPGAGYEQTFYPQFNYQSNYPKVSYTNALPYPAPVYRQFVSTTPKPTKKATTEDSEESDNSAEYIKVRNIY